MKNACVGIIRNYNNEILLLKRNASPLGFGLPGGKQEENESLLQCVIREVKEETGIVILSAIYDRAYLSYNETFNVHVFECIPITYDVELSGEHSEFIWIPEDKLESIELAGNTSKFLDL